MTINPMHLTGQKRRYFIVNDDGEFIAWFDNLETAGVVIRYLKGAPMLREDGEAARAALRRFDQRGNDE